MILKEAGLPLADYYAYLSSMREEIPIMSSYGVYYDKNGHRYLYEEHSPYSTLVQNYFILEYKKVFK